MCGLAGWVSLSPLNSGPTLLRQMTDSIAHRGPDAAGHWVWQAETGGTQVALGHRRLAIIDLSGGAQPMHGPEGSVVVFNGEIYNFQELRAELAAHGLHTQTQSDTEILLLGYQRWGDGLVEKLRGMFAFALWDAAKRRLLLARDRFGKKPLFYAEWPGGVAFASEIKALWALPALQAELEPAALGDYLKYRFVPGPRTFFRGVRKLPAGHIARFVQGSLVLSGYYTLPDSQPRVAVAEDGDPVAGFATALEAAVKMRLISDVPLGAFLSGGLDSSVIVALMSRLGAKPVRTFSIGFAENQYSELPYAEVVARQLDCAHHPIPFSEHDLVDLLPEATRFRDAPVSEPADLPMYLLSQAAAKEVKVVLTGEGADELLAGYPKHLYERFTGLYHWLPQRFHTLLVEPLVQQLPYRFRRIKTLSASFGQHNFDERMARWFGALSPEQQQSLLAAPIPPLAFAERAQGGSALRRILHFDQAVWLPDNLLERGDRMTMAHGLEGRNPFLDHPLAERVSALPDNVRVRGMTGKWLLRQAARHLLPPVILNRPKSGFRMPVNEWFRGPMRGYVQEMLLTPSSRLRSVLHPSALNNLLEEHLSGRHNHEKALWMLLALELFLRQTGLNP